VNEILITICARGGSKGVPNKNIKFLNGKPLIAYTINAAKSFAEVYNADISLSTDDNKIKNIASKFGLITSYQRPANLAKDQTGKIEVIYDLLIYEENRRGKKYTYILDMDVTSPLRNFKDLNEAFEILKQRSDALNIFSVSPARRNPYFNMVEHSHNGYFKLVKSCGDIKSRQAAPKVYDINASFYIFRRAFFDENLNNVITDKSLAYVVNHICFDIDDIMDFKIMEIIFREKLLDFEL